MLETEFRALLLADAGVMAIAGSRIEWGQVAQGTAAPYIALHMIGPKTQGINFDGGDGKRTARIQVNCYGADYGAASLLADAVVDLLDGYRAGNFKGIFHANTRAENSGTTAAAERLFGLQLDFMTHWKG